MRSKRVGPRARKANQRPGTGRTREVFTADEWKAYGSWLKAGRLVYIGPVKSPETWYDASLAGTVTRPTGFYAPAICFAFNLLRLIKLL